MKFIDYSVRTGKENMQIDSDLLDEAIEHNYREPVFRLYGWSPACVSLGRNQKEDFIDNRLLKEMKIDCVRRLTGGRALLHDNELTYSYISPADIIPNGKNVAESYKYISGIWIEIFRNLGIELTLGSLPRHITKNNYCMAISTGADLCKDGKKFIGSAQCRKNGYILQHGSILIDYDKEKLDKVFNEKTDYSTITTLKEINNSLDLTDIINSVKTVIL
ncbi:MAG: lipoate--protein ligase family protein [Cyanobacteria bacterium RUI128]|nr:lipoate--protein ligase family protein [Cyanobacteria bacterium RUI128]